MTRISIVSPRVLKLVRFLRIACLVAAGFAAFVCVLAWRQHLYALATINALLVGVNLTFAWIQWKVFNKQCVNQRGRP